MLLANLIVAGRNWAWLAAVVMLVGLATLVWSYRTAPAGFARWYCPLLKALGLGALAACLLEPLWSGQHVRPGANLFAIVADNSQSLQIKDRGADQSRGQFLLGLLNPQRGRWQQNLDDNFEVRRYYFDSRLQATKDFGELSFDGRASAIGATLHSLAERFYKQPLAGILLLSDGNATDLRGVPNLEGLPPIYPVVMGRSDAIRDLAIQQVHTTQTDFEDAPVSVQADVGATGYRYESVAARLFDDAGKQVAEQILQPRKDDDLLAFRFQFRPTRPGLSFYQLRVSSKSENSLTPDSSAATEATLANNSSTVVVDRGHGTHRILYVAGRPNWEFKFLNRALEADDQLQLVGLIRVAKREPKFTFMGRAGESSNPLYRGFANQSAEETERYDQPVLVPINPREPLELRGGFPKTAEELYAYQAVILDDLEAEFFTADQAALLQRFVSERGGGLLMLGGMESFQQGNYLRTPIGDMLPVYLDAPPETRPPGPLHLAMTPEGSLQSWARLRDNEADEKARLQNVAPFRVLNKVREVKPGASVILTATDKDGKVFPALVVQRFGRGRTAALTLGDVWHWGLHDADAHRDMDKAWRQLTRWLVNDVPNRVELAVEPQADEGGGGVLLQVRVRDAKFQPLDDANVSLLIQPVMADAGGRTETNSIRLQAEPALQEPGLYQATYVPRFAGGYQASAAVTNSAGLEVGRAAAGWSVNLAGNEFRSLKPDVGSLEAIARRTGGELVPAESLDGFVRKLSHRHAPVMEAWTFPLWHTPAMFGFAMLCLLAEWGLRRLKGMP